MKSSIGLLILFIGVSLLFTGSREESTAKTVDNTFRTRGSHNAVLKDRVKVYTVSQLDSMLCKANANIIVAKYTVENNLKPKLKLKQWKNQNSEN